MEPNNTVAANPEENQIPKEFSIDDFLNTSNAQIHDAHIMRHYLMRMLKKKNHEQFLAELPTTIQKRLQALKKLQIETMELDAVFHRKAFEMEKDFQAKHNEIFRKRMDIILGVYEPNDTECELPEGQTQAVCEKVSKIKLPVGGDEAKENTKGIPDFWLTVLKYVPKVDVLVKEYDEPLLKHLVDIKVRTKSEPELSFLLEFHFSPNEYFTNEILEKEYFLKCSPDPMDPFSFDGPEIYKSTATTINWKEGKNVTMEKKTINGVEEEVSRGSFFNFFSPPDLPEDPNNAMYMTINVSSHSFYYLPATYRFPFCIGNS